LVKCQVSSRKSYAFHAYEKSHDFEVSKWITKIATMHLLLQTLETLDEGTIDDRASTNMLRLRT
jgi:hypothetical protein